jgi:hypothetical protein
MVHPLDPALAHFYGQFVQAAYTMFRDPKGGDPLKPEPEGIPDGWELAAWIHMSDFLLTLKEPEFYGIICRKADDPDTRIVAIRGTEGAVEWIDDAAALPTPFRQVPSAGRVASGFDRIYTSIKVVKRKLPEDKEAAAKPEMKAAAEQERFLGSFADQLHQLAVSRELVRGKRRSLTEARPPRPMVVTGHSLGAALATLFVMENDSKKKFDISTCCTFASPRVGNLEFARAFDQLPVVSWRIVNSLDIVPKLPPHIPLLLEYDHVDTEFAFSSEDFAKHSLVCWHAMETYLHWLNPNTKVRPECAP